MTVTIQPDAQALTDRLFANLGDAGPADVAIIPGDPDRVDIVTAFMEDVRTYDFARGYRGASGLYRGKRVYILSSGIGGAGFERALIELHLLGVGTVIRVGTTGALRDDIDPGDFVVNEGSVRLDGTSHHYVRAEYPAIASWDVVGPLVAEARAAGNRVFTGIGATTSSFFAGQGRTTLAGWAPRTDVVDEMRQAGVINFEMEAATQFTLARLFGMRSAAICVVVNNRLKGTMGGKDKVPLACEVALKVAARLDVSVAA